MSILKNIFLNSLRKHLLWVLIRSAEALLMSTTIYFFHREIRKVTIFFLVCKCKMTYLE